MSKWQWLESRCSLGEEEKEEGECEKEEQELEQEEEEESKGGEEEKEKLTEKAGEEENHTLYISHNLWYYGILHVKETQVNISNIKKYYIDIDIELFKENRSNET